MTLDSLSAMVGVILPLALRIRLTTDSLTRNLSAKPFAPMLKGSR